MSIELDIVSESFTTDFYKGMSLFVTGMACPDDANEDVVAGFEFAKTCPTEEKELFDINQIDGGEHEIPLYR